jgi:phosphomannomutase/phosphoglucomutase
MTTLSRKGMLEAKAPAVPGRGHGMGIGTYWLMAYAALVVVLLLALAGAATIFGANEARIMERHLRAYSGTLGQEVSNRTAAVRGQLKRWRDDPGLRAALLDGRPSILRDKEAELELLVPGALAVMVFTSEDTAPGGLAAQRLSFAGLDMVQQVKNQRLISPLEAHRVHQEDEHLAIAGPVTDVDGGEVLGVVHIMLPLSLLPHAAAAAPGQGYVLFRQRVGDQVVAVSARDVEQPPPRAPSVRLPIADTRLELLAWAPSPGLLGGGQLPMLAGLYGLSLLLAAAALGLPYHLLRRGVEADLSGMVALTTDAVAQRPLQNGRGHVRELVAATETLRRRLRELAPSHQAAPGFPPELALSAPEVAGDELDMDGSFGLELPADNGEAVAAPLGPASADARAAAGARVPPQIFRAYDIRGLVGSELNDRVFRLLGRAVGSEAAAQARRTCVIARDQRPSSAGFAEALAAGLRESGCDVVDLGVVPTPLAYQAAFERGAASAAIVTASHNPADYNGLKVVLAGRAASQDQIRGLCERIERGDFERGAGTYIELDPVADYIRAVCDDVTLARPMKLVVGCGFATASRVAPALFRALECEVVELDCGLDAEQADRRMPDPSQPKNLLALGDAVIDAGAELGVAFDADADRLGIVDSLGKFIAADRILMLLASDVLARSPGSDIVYDVKCSHHLGAAVLQAGGRPVMWRSGHSFIKQKMRELDAPLGGEYTGHFVVAERWNGFDDALYAAARLLEVLALDPRPSTEVFADFRVGNGTPELFLPLAGDAAAEIMQAVLALADQLDGVEVNVLDGLRAEFDQGWGLVRASNTQPGLVFRFEADDQIALNKIQDLFRRMMDLVAPELALPF